MTLLSIALVLVCFFCFFPQPTTSKFLPFESSTAWKIGPQVDDQEIFELLTAVHPEDIGALEEYFWKVSNPRNRLYGEHLTRDEADRLTKPQQNVMARVQDWLSSFNGSKVVFSSATNIFRTSVPVHILRSKMNVTMHEFHHTRMNRRILRSITHINVPEYLHSYISFINLNTRPVGLVAKPHVSRTRKLISQSRSNIATPSFIRKIYNIPENLKVTNPRNTQCVAEFYEESWSKRDLEIFYNATNISIRPKVVDLGNRENKPSEASGEASLDLQYITAIAPNATTFVWSMKGNNPYSSIDEPFLEWAEQVLGTKNPPFVFSMSYSDDEDHVVNANEHYIRAFDDVIKKLGARGITVLFSSGDDGVAGQRIEVAKISVEEGCKRNGPQWPSSSPYITSVGATMFLKSQKVDNYFRSKDEVVCSGKYGGVITTGGGFSNIYSQPPYQSVAVNRYIKSRSSPQTEGFYNKSGRGYPDLAAFGAEYLVFVNGGERHVAGTSASTPVVAAMITLWNERRLNAGKSSLGFINPLLYLIAEKNRTAFNDVVIGNNAASQGLSYECNDSFSASVGWDASTGLGSPNFIELSELTFMAESLGNESYQTTKPNVDNKVEGMINTYTVILLSAGWVLFAVVLMIIGWNRYRSIPYRSIENRDEKDISDCSSSEQVLQSDRTPIVPDSEDEEKAQDSV